MEYAVSRGGTTLVTLHEGTDTTARAAAAGRLASIFEEADGFADWSVGEASVYEGPTAPFDPYTVAVEFGVTVVVEADDTGRARSRGSATIADALDAAGLEGVSYGSPAEATAT